MCFDKSLIKKIFFVFISLLPFTIIAPISYYLASSLSVGSVSYIGFSQSFSGFISVAAGMGISIVSFPNLVNELSNGNIKAAKLNMELALKFILIIAMLSIVGFLSLKTPLLLLLYGKAGASKLNIVQLSKIIPLYLISAVFIAGLNQVRTLYYAEGKYKQLALLSALTLIIFSILSWFLRDLLDFLGIGIANLITMLLFFILSIYYLEDREKNTIFSYNFFLFFIRIITLLSITGFITYQLNHIISFWILPTLAIFVSGLIYLIVTFFFAKKVIKVEELIMVEKTICKLIYKNRQ
jgi:peptidoglycan biosynthesis protein MviN/MurJ (putative lipid II flippase)